ncbi:uncharacterized protein [Ambystoma mexicanum]|uniref:uncharacterized protein isoform X2 n=1 Tax=Ambystoma mexicanum TaxID=8296 RepID=UPI0037E79E20
MHLPSALCACAWLLRELHMDLQSALCALRSLLGGVSARALPGVLHTLRGDAFEDLFQCNEDAVLRNIAGELREALPAEAMLSSEHQAMQKMQQSFEPTVHVDSFLYEDTLIDQLCEEGRMSRHYCLSCGSQQTAPLGFISHSFSLVELKFLFQHALPDLSGKTLVDIGSRLGAVLFGVLHADICTQASLLQDADVIVLNNVFEYFLDEDAQISAWTFINSCVCKMGALLVTVPALEESLGKLQTGIDLNHWVEEVQLDYNVYLGADTDSEALQNIHLYRVR